MEILIAAGLIFLLSVIGARAMNERGLKLLNTQEKGLLVEAHADLSKYQLFFLLAIVGLYFLLMKLFPEHVTTIMIVYFVALVGFMILLALIVSNRLKKLGIPSTYTKAYVLSTFIRTGGMILAMALLLYNLNSKQI